MSMLTIARSIPYAERRSSSNRNLRSLVCSVNGGESPPLGYLRPADKRRVLVPPGGLALFAPAYAYIVSISIIALSEYSPRRYETPGTGISDTCLPENPCLS